MTIRPSLFGEVKRTDASPRQGSESLFSYLNRSADRVATAVRTRLDMWFERFPVEACNDVRARFRKDDDRAHKGAVFELFIHELLTHLGCTVEVHPSVPGKGSRPDFLVHHEDCHFYVETTYIEPSTSPFARDPLEDDAVAKINSLHSPDFYLWAQVEGKLSSAPSREHVVRPFLELLAAHTPDDVQRAIDVGGPFAAPSRTVTYGSWSVQGWLVPIVPQKRSSGRSGPLVIGPGRVEATDSSTPVQNAIMKKANKYGHLESPLVVAVNVWDPFFGRSDEMEALFGKEQIVYYENLPGPSVKLSREPDGVWIQGGYQPRYTRLAAVLIFRGFVPWNLRNVPTCFYVNPFAGSMKPPAVLYRLPHAQAHLNKIRWFGGEDVGRMLDD